MLKKDYTNFSKTVSDRGKEASSSNDNAFSAYGLASKDRGSPIMLDVRQKTGDRTALSYAYLTSMAWNPSQGLTLYYTSHTITLRGRNLEDLYETLRQHRVEFVQEEDPRYDEGSETDPFLEEIVVQKI